MRPERPEPRSKLDVIYQDVLGECVTLVARLEATAKGLGDAIALLEALSARLDRLADRRPYRRAMLEWLAAAMLGGIVAGAILKIFH